MDALHITRYRLNIILCIVPEAIEWQLESNGGLSRRSWGWEPGVLQAGYSALTCARGVLQQMNVYVDAVMQICCWQFWQNILTIDYLSPLSAFAVLGLEHR